MFGNVFINAIMALCNEQYPLQLSNYARKMWKLGFYLRHHLVKNQKYFKGIGFASFISISLSKFSSTKKEILPVEAFQIPY